MILIIVYTLILLFTDRAAAGALCMQALKQWYETMIPALFPMMLISSILVDTGFAQKIGKILNHTLLRFLRISDSGCYCLLTGFLFGFPMGAKTTADMLTKEALTHKEAEYLLSFINCLGPMYTLNLIHKLFPVHNVLTLLFGVYGLPLFYGFFLRYTLHRKTDFSTKTSSIIHTHHIPLIDALYECVPKCGRSILMLGGYYEEERDAGKAAQSLSALVQQMSDRLYEAGNTEGRFVYGATFCGVWLLGNQAVFINLGDSRAYLLPRYKKKPLQVTEDQNLAGMLVKNGMMTKEEAKGHPASSRLTAFVGMQSPATPDVFIREVHPGDRILLCSDGLYGMTEERELARIMRSSRSPDRICQRLIDSANAHGGCDNIAAVYLQITA